MTRTHVLARGRPRLRKARGGSPAGRAPAGSGTGLGRTSICQGNPLPWVHSEASSGRSKDAGVQAGKPDSRRGRNARDNTVRGKKKARNRLEVTKGPGEGLNLASPAFSSPGEQRGICWEEDKEEKLLGSFYELIKTLITRPVRNSTHTGSSRGKLNNNKVNKICGKEMPMVVRWGFLWGLKLKSMG